MILKKDVFNGKGQKLWKKAKTLIPGGNQLLSKRAELFLPDLWPAYYSKAKGPYIWDLDGRKYLDFSIVAVGACALGYADPDVNRAVIAAVNRGSNASLNVPEEVELAELLSKYILGRAWCAMRAQEANRWPSPLESLVRTPDVKLSRFVGITAGKIGILQPISRTQRVSMTICLRASHQRCAESASGDHASFSLQ
jgi:hypothetical protein